MPERREGACIVEDVHIETVLEIVVTHEAKDIVVDITVVVDLYLSASDTRDKKEASLHQVLHASTSQIP